MRYFALCVVTIALFLLPSAVQAQYTEFPVCSELERQITGAWESAQWSEAFANDHTYIYTEDGMHVLFGTWRCLAPGVIGVTLGTRREALYRVSFPNRRMVIIRSLQNDYTYTARRIRHHD